MTKIGFTIKFCLDFFDPKFSRMWKLKKHFKKPVGCRLEYLKLIESKIVVAKIWRNELFWSDEALKPAILTTFYVRTCSIFETFELSASDMYWLQFNPVLTDIPSFEMWLGRSKHSLWHLNPASVWFIFNSGSKPCYFRTSFELWGWAFHVKLKT